MSLLGKDPIQWDDTIQIRKVHGAGRAEDYQTRELYEKFNLHRLLPGIGEPQMAVPATSEGVKNPIDFEAATPGADGNTVFVRIELIEFPEAETETIIIEQLSKTGFVIWVNAEDSEGTMVTTVTIADLLTEIGNSDAFTAVCTAELQDGEDDGDLVATELFTFTGGIDAEPADIGKRMTVIDEGDFAGEYLCFKPTEPDSDTLAEHWALVNEPSPAKGAAQSPPKK